jgi:hypothetical protein
VLRGFSETRIRRRNRTIKALLVPLVRLWRSPHFVDGCFGLLFLAFAFLAYPFLWLLDMIIRSDAATSGYFVEARKPQAAQ